MLLRETGAARLHSPSSAAGVLSLGGPISPRPRRLPNLLPGAPPSEGPLGLNLLPMVQFSSLSAAPGATPSRLPKPEPRRFGISLSGGGALRGLLERQSLMLSDTAGGGGSRPGGPSTRRRGPSRSRSGSGPSRLHGPANFSSSNPPPLPNPDPFAVVRISSQCAARDVTNLRGSATLMRTVRPARLCGKVSHFIGRYRKRETLTVPDKSNAALRPSSSANSTYPKPFGLSSRSLMILMDLVWCAS